MLTFMLFGLFWSKDLWHSHSFFQVESGGVALSNERALKIIDPFFFQLNKNDHKYKNPVLQQKTMQQPGIQCSSHSSSCCSPVPIFWANLWHYAGARIEPTISLAGCSTNHLHVIRSRALRFAFPIYWKYKVKKGKKIKTLQQNNAILCRAALREKAAPDRAH